MAWYNVLYCSVFLFRGQTVLTVCVKTSFIFTLLRGKKKWKIFTPLSVRKRSANTKIRAVFHCYCKQSSNQGKKKPSKETQKEMIHCLHQAAVQASDRIWKRCGMTPLFYSVLTAAGSGNVLICLQFTFIVRIAVNWL